MPPTGYLLALSRQKIFFYTGDPMAISLKFDRGAGLVSGGEVDAYVVIFAPVQESSDANTDSDENTSDTTGDITTTDTQSALEALSDTVVLLVSDQANSKEQKLFEIENVDVSTLPAGTYQLGLILTNPGGDPLNINDWFRGLLGLIDIVGLTISDEALSIDADGDGEVDNDLDDNGFSDDVDDDSSTSTDKSGST